MKWLLWREYRLNRLILIAGGAFFVLPYAIVGFTVLTGSYQMTYVTRAWLASTYAAQLLIALLAGNAIAGERADRSAEFIAYLPLSRRRIVASKVLFALLVFTPVWCVTRVVIDNAYLPAPGYVSGSPAHVLSDLRPFLANVVLLYGAGWLFTSRLSSATAASVLGLVVVILLHVGYVFVLIPQKNFFEEFIRLLNDQERFGDAVFWYTMICISLAVISFSIGTWNYVGHRRS